jgi:Fe-S cluster biogenesis protein NfuA
MVVNWRAGAKTAVKWLLIELELYEVPVTESPRTSEPTPPQDAVDPLEDHALSMANVQQVLDDMIRPALQADGGDITLLKIEDGDVFVRLVGACSSCPSAIMTMKMGVERLLVEEFPDMGELVQINGGMF